jgi:hypothetical protein
MFSEQVFNQLCGDFRTHGTRLSALSDSGKVRYDSILHPGPHPARTFEQYRDRFSKSACDSRVQEEQICAEL